ncbi:DUF433 domain-containing protein [Candidatus Woesearchaeota archaeon]|nr:DUF433 domain-containing protein [Candidatus Woesearchaeota archaeon]
MAKEIESKIVKDEAMSGSPRVAGTRIRVRDIVEKYIVSGYPPEAIAEAFSLPLAAVYEALSYYYGHLLEIQEEIKKDKEFIEKFKKEFKHEILS